MPSPSPGSRPAALGLRAAWGPARSSPELLGGLQRGNRRTRVLLNQGVTHAEGSWGRWGPLWLQGLALIWSPAPGIPRPPRWRGAFPAGLPLPVEITSFPFLFRAGGLAGARRRGGGGSRRDNKLLSARWERHRRTGAKGTPACLLTPSSGCTDEGTVCRRAWPIPRQVCLCIALPSVTVAKDLRGKDAGAPVLGALKTCVESQQRNPLQGQHPSLGFRVLIWDSGAHPNATTPGELRKVNPEAPLDSSRHFPGKPRGEGAEER